jgi:hypothetical protein
LRAYGLEMQSRHAFRRGHRGPDGGENLGVWVSALFTAPEGEFIGHARDDGVAARGSETRRHDFDDHAAGEADALRRLAQDALLEDGHRVEQAPDVTQDRAGLLAISRQDLERADFARGEDGRVVLEARQIDGHQGGDSRLAGAPAADGPRLTRGDLGRGLAAGVRRERIPERVRHGQAEQRGKEGPPRLPGRRREEGAEELGVGHRVQDADARRRRPGCTPRRGRHHAPSR